MRFCINGELNLNNGAGYDIAALIQVGEFDRALDITRYALHEYINELFQRENYLKRSDASLFDLNLQVRVGKQDFSHLLKVNNVT